MVLICDVLQVVGDGAFGRLPGDGQGGTHLCGEFTHLCSKFTYLCNKILKRVVVMSVILLICV